MPGLLTFAILALPIVIAITFHEAAHAFAAHALGDDTAEREGRLTLNPLAHIDPVGTLLLPAVLILTTGIAFGYAKPVPVDLHKLRNEKRDSVLVAAAGPAMNVVLAIFIALLLLATRGIAEDYPLWGRALEASIVVNFVLILLNLIPLPPLDGSKIFAAFLTPGVSERYFRLEPYGFLIVAFFFLIVPVVSPSLGFPMDTTEQFLTQPAYALTNELLSMLGAS